MVFEELIVLGGDEGVLYEIRDLFEPDRVTPLLADLCNQLAAVRVRVRLQAEEWAVLAPAKAEAGATWSVPNAVARKFTRLLSASSDQSGARNTPPPTEGVTRFRGWSSWEACNSTRSQGAVIRESSRHCRRASEEAESALKAARKWPMAS
jgi:hypothetical protein